MWLRNFVENFSQEDGSIASRKAQSEEMYKGAQRESFCGITTKSYEGVVDTAAEGGLVGTLALSRLQVALKQRGLKCKWTPKQSSAKGVGGAAHVVGVVWIPIGISGMNGILECTVVEGEVPLLLPVQLLKQLRVALNFFDYTFVMSEHEKTVKMHELPSGHVTIEVLQFHEHGFSLPAGVPGMIESDFINERFVGAMSAQLNDKATVGTTHQLGKTPVKCHGVHHGPPTPDERCDGIHFKREQDEGEQPRSSAEEGGEGMASGARQDLHVDRVHRTPARRPGMVSRRGDAGGYLCPPHHAGQEAGTFEEQGGQQLCAPQSQSQGGWQSRQLLHHLQDVPQPLGEHYEVNPAEEHPVIQSQVLQEALQKAEFEKMKEVGAVKTIDKPICLCGRPAELRAMKKEGPRRGRKYWNCAETACEFFQWLPTEADPDAMSVTSFNLGGNRDSSQRSKSPRTIRSEPKKTEGPIEVESDGTL